MLYPLKFKTIFKDKIWGGNKINSILNKDYSPLPNCGETWEISGVAGNVSVVEYGDLKNKTLTDLIDQFKGDLLGPDIYGKFGKEFPLLIKFIDANEDLSIQVHPDDVLGKARHNSFGKTEMWYIFQADPGSSLIVGFNKNTNPEEYQASLENGKLMEILNREIVSVGDCYFIPAGRVHTIGKGLLLAEIQQTSDVTYRIYDFDRLDDKGQKRELHTEESVEALDYKFYPQYKINYSVRKNDETRLAKCQYFTTNLLVLDKSTFKDYTDKKSFVILICFEGTGIISTEEGKFEIKKGDSYLIPFSVKNLSIIPVGEIKILEVYIEI
ncbi:MAG: class I mannose-6-phosphate isomerase [Opitutaceae bacterium]|nr:class I mannose-6-phosphate isomerase [Cytophagales bacterium]